MRWQNNFLLFLFSVFLISCEGDHEQKGNAEKKSDAPVGFETVNLTRQSADVMLPTELWDRMESIYHSTHTTGFGGAGQKNDGKHAEKGKKEGISTKIEIPTQYMGLKAYLAEKDIDVLGGKNYELLFGLGGGELDLKEFVKKGKKQFTFSLSIDESYTPKDTLRVFFLGNSKAVKLGSTEWGAGCQKYMDITNYFTKTLSHKGILVSAADLRYLRVLAGSFFFVLNKNNSLYLAQLKVTDSRYKNIYCRS
ncbi:MAG: hypothetical protein A4S09_15800 [Proteobacteria bacterium SG_bin7]|nr:MAG: hypothetical protein A4S09_15800 [Proteobacteria bacterium SG_bin7]